MWLGLYGAAFRTFEGFDHIAIMSPLLVIYFLTRFTGIPILEKKAQRKWGKDPNYIVYNRRTSVLVPYVY